MEIINKLRKRGVKFEEGLSQGEFTDIEAKYSITFPPDLKDFLSNGLPVSNNFVNWRNIDDYNQIMGRLNWPLEGMIYDIQHNSFWYDGWGNRPNSLDEAINKCKNEIALVPRMVPICSHRYIPSEPFESGNPIMSIYQTDIIYYGEDLESYLEVEFAYKEYREINFGSIKRIRFWSDIIG